ncbi:MAG: lysophospholipid acyltransferase family protein [Deltaproteobacteria bacterium]|nr:lysophospholipid acyltransferase family protein [Deltaproteobacteria bacterium]
MAFDSQIENLLERVFKLIGSIPPNRHIAIANFLGRLWFSLDKRHKIITLDNLSRAYKNKMSKSEQEILAKSVFINLVRFILDMCWGLNRSPEELKAHIDYSESVHLKKALKKGKGALILTGHLGNWEFLPLVPAFEGIKANAVYRPLDYKPMDNFTQKMRSRTGTGLIHLRGAVEKIVAALNKNEAIGLLMDQNASFTTGVVVDFFGRKTMANKGLALLALKTGAPVVPAFLIREGEGLKLVSGPEIPLIKTGDKRKDMELNTQQYNQVIEKYVRKYPEQWFWVHRRWKSKVSSPWPRQNHN